MDGTLVGSQRSPEEALVLACARTIVPVEAREPLRALASGPLDWDRVLRLAEVHGVTPLLHHQLTATAPAEVPAAVRARLRERMIEYAGRSLALAHELAGLLGALAERGILALPYKGPALAEAVYGGVTLRPPGDLDVVVPPERMTDARAVLLGRGYRDALPGVALEARVSHYQHALVRDRDHVHVELHWAFAPRYFGFALRPRDLAHEPLRLAGATVRTIAPADLLVVLAVHGGRHLWSRLVWICDLAELLRARPAADWDAALARARALGVARMVLVGVALARDLLAARLPEGLDRALGADHAALSLARTLAAGFFTEDRGHVPLTRAARLHLAMRERWRDRLAYAVLGPLTPSEHDAPRLAGRLRVLRGLARPVGLLRRHRLLRRRGAAGDRPPL
jgi:hypothetical protein